MGRGIDVDAAAGRAFPHTAAVEPNGVALATADHELVYLGPASMGPPTATGQSIASGMFEVRTRRDAEPARTKPFVVAVGQTSFLPWLRDDGRPVLLTVMGFNGQNLNAAFTRPTGPLYETYRRTFSAAEPAAEDAREAAGASPDGVTVPPPDSGDPGRSGRSPRRRRRRDAADSAAEAAAQADADTDVCEECGRPEPKLTGYRKALLRTALGRLARDVSDNRDDARKLAVSFGLCGCMGPQGNSEVEADLLSLIAGAMRAVS